MDAITFVGIVIGSAAFGAVTGKLLEAFLLTPIVDKYEKKKWLRQTKIEAFSKLIEEMLSLGFKNKLHDDRWLFLSLATKTILLLEDEAMINKIHKFIDDLYKINTDLSSVVTSNLPDDFSVKLPSGEIATKKHFERGVAIDILEKEAINIAKKLGGNLRKT